MAKKKRKTSSSSAVESVVESVESGAAVAGATGSASSGSASAVGGAKKPVRLWVKLLVVVLIAAIAYEAFVIARWSVVAWSLSSADRMLTELDYEGAKVRLAAADRWSPDHPQVQLQLAKTYRHLGETGYFESHLESAERLGAAPEQIERERLLMAVQGGYLEQTVDKLQRVMVSESTTDREAAEIYEALAKGYLAVYRVRDSLNALNSWLEWQPESVAAHFLRADIFYRMGNYRAALREYEQVLEQLPDHFESHQNAARVMLDSNALEQALGHFRRARELRPDSMLAAMELASCELKVGNDDEAVAICQEVLEQPIQDGELKAQALGLLGEIDLRKGEYVDALEYLREAVDLSPRDYTLVYALSRALTYVGAKEEAKEYFSLSEQLKNDELRLRDLTVGLVQDPGDLKARFEVATILFRQGKQEPAVMWLETIVKENGDFAPAHELLAQYYSLRGKAELARGHAERAQLLRVQGGGAQAASGAGEGAGGEGSNGAGGGAGGDESGGRESSGAETEGEGNTSAERGE